MPTGEGHFTLRDEAVRIFGSLLAMEVETFESIEEEAKMLRVSSIFPNLASLSRCMQL